MKPRPEPSFSRQGSKSGYGGPWPQQQQPQQAGEDDDDDDLFGDVPKVEVDEDEEEDDEEDWEDVNAVADAHHPRSSVHIDGSSSSVMFDHNLDKDGHTHSRNHGHPDGGSSPYPNATTRQSRQLQTQLQQVTTDGAFSNPMPYISLVLIASEQSHFPDNHHNNTITTTTTQQGGRTRWQRYLSRMSSFRSSSQYSMDAVLTNHNHNNNANKMSKNDSFVSGDIPSLDHQPSDIPVTTGKGPLKDGHADDLNHNNNNSNNNNSNNNNHNNSSNNITTTTNIKANRTMTTGARPPAANASKSAR